MTHELSATLQQTRRIRQRCAVKEPHVDVRGEYIHVAEWRISQTRNRTAVMQKLPDFVAALSHHLKPLLRHGSQFACVLFHPSINGGLPLDRAVESQQVRSHRPPPYSLGNNVPIRRQRSLQIARHVEHAAYSIMPPDTSILWPFTQRFSSERNAAIIGPISSGTPARPSAVISATRLLMSGLSRTIPPLKSVWMAPGATTFTV